MTKKEAILTYLEYEVDEQKTYSIQIEYTGQSHYIYPRTKLETVVRLVNQNLEKILFKYPEYSITIDKSMNDFFNLGYKWNDIEKRIVLK